MAELADTSYLNDLILELNHSEGDKEKSCTISIEIFSYLIKFPELIREESYIPNIAQMHSDEIIKITTDAIRSKEITSQNGTILINKIKELKLVADEMFNKEEHDC